MGDTVRGAMGEHRGEGLGRGQRPPGRGGTRGIAHELPGAPRASTAVKQNPPRKIEKKRRFRVRIQKEKNPKYGWQRRRAVLEAATLPGTRPPAQPRRRRGWWFGFGPGTVADPAQRGRARLGRARLGFSQSYIKSFGKKDIV